ncbi:snare-complex protein syntaxin-18 N-terminus-domain-containing protein [Endogone sp. FLAS-F59071]|nr:snare-complex protein syntaxin-18 N-terminus-domain-containing protein [Endogone sp. FLAS-F59071]|eukprot:RUS20579.1 snare-complex protein syntaxin-18 N-terminus-domain-containing protein [Endogone sp. FLAS-F59071]
MPDITSEFRQAVDRIAKIQPPSSRSSSKKQPHRAAKEDPRDVNDEFMKEAYRIASQVSSLKTFLLSIRRAYLNTSRTARWTPTPATNNGMLLTAEGITHLTDKERDEIDLQAKTIITRCMDRIEELEGAEKARQAAFTTLHANPLTRLFAQALAVPTEVSAGDILAAHRSGVIWLLKTRLIEVSHIQKNQQETRVARAMEKSENLLYKSSNPAALPASRSAHPNSASSSRPSSRPSSLPSRQSLPPQTVLLDDDNKDDALLDAELSPQQLQMLEAENAGIMKELEGTLEQVKSAEKALLEIATLSTQLSTNLAAQTELTDRLHAEAVATTGRVVEGNAQLAQARERNAGTRKWVLVFLLTASVVILFLDWYD